MTNAIELIDVTRTFGTGEDRTVAVDGLSFAVPQGSVFGLLGANGAGKTTAIRMMVSHLLPDRGEVRVLGEDPARQSESLRRRVAYISENMQLPSWMTLADATAFCEKIYPKKYRFAENPDSAECRRILETVIAENKKTGSLQFGIETLAFGCTLTSSRLLFLRKIFWRKPYSNFLRCAIIFDAAILNSLSYVRGSLCA